MLRTQPLIRQLLGTLFFRFAIITLHGLFSRFLPNNMLTVGKIIFPGEKHNSSLSNIKHSSLKMYIHEILHILRKLYLVIRNIYVHTYTFAYICMYLATINEITSKLTYSKGTIQAGLEKRERVRK